MINFLKKYSTIPEKFIDDFYEITKETYSSREFVIDFDVVVKWLVVRKDNLKATPIKNFDEDIDYISKMITKKHQNNKGATITEIITLTPLCFKELCMISTSKNARDVRMFYISLEDLVSKYHFSIEKDLRPCF